MTLISFSTTQISAFRIALEAIESLVSDVVFLFSPNGISIKDLDKTGNLLISAFFDAGKFDEYNFDCGYDTYKIGIPIDAMVRGIKSNLPYDVLTFTLSNGNTTTITCNLTSKERNESKVCYIQPIDLAVNNNNIKEIVNTARIDISPSLISKYIKDLNHVCDTVRIELNNERMVLTGLVEDKAVVSHFIKKGNTLGITIDDTTEGVPTKTISIKRLVLLNK
jgi:hypothetical protein